MKLDKHTIELLTEIGIDYRKLNKEQIDAIMFPDHTRQTPVSYTHLRAHETDS